MHTGRWLIPMKHERTMPCLQALMSMTVKTLQNLKDGWTRRTGLQHDRQKSTQGINEEVSWCYQGDTINDECSLDWWQHHFQAQARFFINVHHEIGPEKSLRDLKQSPGQPISSYMYKYGGSISLQQETRLVMKGIQQLLWNSLSL